jgi:putative membrane protein
MQRLALPAAIVVAIATAAGCSGGNNNNNPAQGNSTAPMPAAPAPTTSGGSPLYNPAGTATAPSTAAMPPGATTMGAATSSTSAMANGGGFASEAARAGMLEVKLADLALQKSNNSDVKSFAREMKQDHTQADQKLEQAAGSGAQLPMNLNADQQQQLSSLESKSGTAFDKAYADEEVQDHQKEVSLFQKASTSAPTEQLRNYASQTLPTLKDHLKRAQQLQAKVGG